MIDITLENFESDLIHASMAQPVLLDIWAPWCGPCKSLGPILEKLEQAYGGRFLLAKVNSDEQPEIAGQLSQSFGVRSIPFCVMFHQGQPVDGFVGALPEAQIREFLDKHVAPGMDEPAADAEIVDDAPAEPSDALAQLAAAVAQDPGNDALREDWVKALLTAGQDAAAREAFAPLAAKVLQDSRAAALARWITAFDAAAAAAPDADLQAAIGANKRDFDARFAWAQRRFAQGQFTQAMDELLEIIMRDKAWNQEAARKAYVAILEIMTPPQPKPSAAKAPAAAGPAGKGALEIAGSRTAAIVSDPVVDQYRRKLSMALF